CEHGHEGFVRHGRRLERTMIESVPVDGGDLTVGVEGSAEAPAVLAIHGITAHHLAWQALARALPDVRRLAPDLRGRGRSRALPTPYGLRQHAADLERLLDAFGIERVPVVGHSMGGFVAVALADRIQDRVSELVLVDGGLPLERPEGVDDARLPEVVLGSVIERLRMRFEGPEAHLAFWRRHPAFAGDDWSPDIERYVAYDLVQTADGWRSAAVEAAMTANALELYGPDWYLDALRGLRMPATVFRAPLGLLAEPPGLYRPGRLESFRDLVPQLRVVEVADVNHYTIAMAEPGAGL